MENLKVNAKKPKPSRKADGQRVAGESKPDAEARSFGSWSRKVLVKPAEPHGGSSEVAQTTRLTVPGSPFPLIPRHATGARRKADAQS